MIRGFLLFFFSLAVFSSILKAQTGKWELWASGLQQGVSPRMTIAPNHDIFYNLLGTGLKKGVIYKANALASAGNFVAMDTIPYPKTLVNNIFCITTNKNSEPIAGIFRSNVMDPWLFRFDNVSKKWVTATTNLSPTLGAYSIARSPNGTIWVGAKWSYIYKSTDNGNTYTQIDESISTQQNFPCHFPSWINYNLDGAIYGINVDKNGRVYAGTESAGVLYSDDEGLNWRPADFHPCQDLNPTLKDSSSAMKALDISGNVSGFGFTSDNNLVWSGAGIWTLNWKNSLGFADMTNNTVTPVLGLPDYLVTIGQQVTKIVTASNGQMFLHSGGASNASGIGIYTSMDGINWTLFNTGITGVNDGQSQGSLAVDSNMVFMATHDGKVFRYIVGDIKTKTQDPIQKSSFSLSPNPANNTVKLELNTNETSQANIGLYNIFGKKIYQIQFEISPNNKDLTIDTSTISPGIYLVVLDRMGQLSSKKLIIER